MQLYRVMFINRAVTQIFINIGFNKSFSQQTSDLVEPKRHSLGTQLLDVRPGFRIPVGDLYLFRLHNVQTDSGAHPAFHSMDTVRYVYAGNGVGNQPGCDVFHSLPSSADSKNWWSSTSTPICLHGAYRDRFSFDFLIAVTGFCYWFA